MLYRLWMGMPKLTMALNFLDGGRQCQYGIGFRWIAGNDEWGDEYRNGEEAKDEEKKERW